MPKTLIPWQFLVENIVFTLSKCTSLVAIYSKSLSQSRLAVRMMILENIVNISSSLHFYWFKGEEFNPELYPGLTFISLQEYAFILVLQLGLTWCAYLIVKDLEARDVRVAAAATDSVYEVSTGKDIEEEKIFTLGP
ncbi:hypothetical protein BGZ81_009133 [Podila clonocystis]|nr:hypothetical protein BGZ81_009133 [Podila clonocystis]